MHAIHSPHFVPAFSEGKVHLTDQRTGRTETQEYDPGNPDSLKAALDRAEILLARLALPDGPR